MTARLPRELGPAALIAAASMMLPMTGSAANGTSRGDLVASAHASPAVSTPRDERSAVVRLRPQGRARAAATSSSTCDGCDSVAIVVEVVHGRRGAVVDNVAAAWASCTGCDARSVAVQVVVVPGRAGVDLVATNRALAVNAACDMCTTDALAVQYVVVGGNGRALSRRVRAELESLAQQLALTPTTASPQKRSLSPGPSPPEDRALDGLADAIEGDLGGAVTLHVDQRRG